MASRDVGSVYRAIGRALVEAAHDGRPRDPLEYTRNEDLGAGETAALTALDSGALHRFATRLAQKAGREEGPAQWWRTAKPSPPPAAPHPAATSSWRAGRPAPPSPSPPLVGLTYRPELFQQIGHEVGLIDVWELVADSFLVPGGPSAIEEFGRTSRLTLHSLRLSIGSPDARDPEQVAAMRDVVVAAGVTEITEHLAWSRIGDLRLAHFAPVWRVEEALQITARNVELLQDALGVRLLVENIATLFDPGGDIGVAQFLNELVRRTGCGIHLDITNMTINEANGYLDAAREFEELDLDAVVAVHVAGGAVIDGVVHDAHCLPVGTRDLAWLELLLPWMPNLKTVVVERDFRFEAHAEVVGDLRTVHDVVARALPREARIVVGDRTLTGTFVDSDHDRHVALRDGVLREARTFDTPPDLTVIDCRCEQGPAIDVVANQLASTGLAAFRTSPPLDAPALAKWAEGLGPLQRIAPDDEFLASRLVDETVFEMRQELEALDRISLERLFSSSALNLHTERAMRPNEEQPRYIVLECLDPPSPDEGNQTLVVAMDRVAEAMDEPALELLTRTRQGTAAMMPVLTSENGRRVFRFRDQGGVAFPWAHDAAPGTSTADVVAAFRHLLEALYGSGCWAIPWETGLVVVLDNRRWFHGRSAGRLAAGRSQRRLLKVSA